MLLFESPLNEREGTTRDTGATKKAGEFFAAKKAKITKRGEERSRRDHSH